MNTTNFHWPTSRAAWAGLIVLTAIGLYYAFVAKDLATASTLIGLALSVLGLGSQATAIQKTQAVTAMKTDAVNNKADAVLAKADAVLANQDTTLANQGASLANQAELQASITNIIENPAMPGKSGDDFTNFDLTN